MRKPAVLRLALAVVAAASACAPSATSSLPGTPDYAAKALKLAQIIRENREFLAEVAASMPPDREGQKLLEEAEGYFEGDIFDVWMNCRDGAKPFPDIQPRDVLQGMVTTMRALAIRPDKAQVPRRFVVVYQDCRRDDHMSHQQAVASIIERREFANRQH
jgi:hypothetical protein